VTIARGSKREGARGSKLAFVDISARADAQDQYGRIIQVRKDHPPTSHSQPKDLFTDTFEATHISYLSLGKLIHCGDDPIFGGPVKAGERLEGLLGPLNPAAHLGSLKRRLTSSWETTSPLAFSSRPSRIAAMSSSVTGSSSRGAASRIDRRGSAWRRRYSRNRLAADSSASGRSSTRVCRVSRSFMPVFYTSRGLLGLSRLPPPWLIQGAALNPRRWTGRRFAPPVSGIQFGVTNSLELLWDGEACMSQRKKRSSGLEVAERNLRAARAALRAAEGEIRDIEEHQREARTLRDSEWLESLERQRESAVRNVQFLRQAVKVEEEAVRQAQVN
jgi:hypothetical protein